MHTETRTFIGETDTDKFDGWAGFRIGTRYELAVTEEGNETIRVQPISILLEGSTFPVLERPGIVMSLAEYKKWFE